MENPANTRIQLLFLGLLLLSVFALTACGSGDDGHHSDGYYLDIYVDDVYVSGDVVEGSFLEICWDVPENAQTNGDYIGLYDVDSGDSFYISYRSTYGDKHGCFDFQISEPGDYEFRYISAYEVVETVHSQHFRVVRGEYPLILSDTQIVIDESITVYWDAPEGADLRYDRIGIYYIVDSNTKYLVDLVYVRPYAQYETFQMLQDGYYQFAYFKNDTDEEVGISEVFVVTFPPPP